LSRKVAECAIHRNDWSTQARDKWTKKVHAQDNCIKKEELKHQSLEEPYLSSSVDVLYPIHPNRLG
jgi:hypothetical protein